MPEHDTTLQTTTDRPWDRRPAITLAGLIVAWYAGTIGIVIAQVL